MNRSIHFPVVLFTAVCLTNLAGCGDGALAGPTSSLGGGGKGDYSILLYIFFSPDHVRQSEDYKQKTQQTAGWADLQVVHKANSSELYRGRFVSPRAAAGTLKAVQAYKTPMGVQLYAKAIVMPLPGQDFGPPELNILNISGMFTVAIAEFYDVPQAGYMGRRKLAVEYVRLLRKEGREAYYYHGPVKSFVCIGSFPESAYPSMLVPPGQGVQPRTPEIKREIQSEQIQQILKKYPFLAVNGRQDIMVLKDGKRVATSSYVMEIPRKEAQENAAFNRTGNQEPGQIP